MKTAAWQTKKNTFLTRPGPEICKYHIFAFRIELFRVGFSTRHGAVAKNYHVLLESTVLNFLLTTFSGGRNLSASFHIGWRQLQDLKHAIILS